MAASKKARASKSSRKQRGVADSMVEPNLKRAVDLVLELMAIPGPSCDEKLISEVVEQKLLQAGATASMIRRDSVHRRTPRPGTVGNLVLKLPGTIRGPRRMFSAHLDTVPICVGCKPVVRDGFVRSKDSQTGLGADDRAGVATILTAATEILQRGLPHPPLTFCWFVQEEIGLQGSRQVSRGVLGKPALAFNWDGGAPEKLTVGATGGCRLEIEVRGVASHAGVAPEWGVSAIAIAGLAVADLQQRGWHGLVKEGRMEGTSNIGVIQGGSATNVVTDVVHLKAEARSHDASFRRRIVNEMEKAFENAAQKVSNAGGVCGSVHIAARTDYESFRLADDDPSVLAAETAVKTVGREPFRALANGGVDANWTTHHGIPTVTIGCGQLHPHMTSEALDLSGFRDACRMALWLATGLGNEPARLP